MDTKAPSQSHVTSKQEMVEKSHDSPASERTHAKHRSHVTTSMLKIGRGLSMIHKAIDSDARDMYDDDDVGSFGGSDDDLDYDSRSDDSDSDRDDDRRENNCRASQGGRQNRKDDDSREYEDPQDDDEPLDDDDRDTRDGRDDKSNSNADQARSAGRNPIKLQDTAPAKTKFVPEKANASSTQAPKSPAAPTGTSKPKAVTKPAAESPAPKAASSEAKPEKPAAKPDPLAPTAAAPFGYKIVKVKKPDGTIVKVKRPLKEEEAAQIAATKAKDIAEKKTTDAVKSNTTESATAAAPATNAQAPPPLGEKKKTSPPPMPVRTDLVDEKSGARISEKEILDGDSEKSPMSPKPAKSLTKHAWNFFQILTWTVMIVFPLIFLALALATAILNKHTIAEKNLRGFYNDPLTQAITVAASMWPIVFAAVVAQTLKAYAAYKVERGIPLMTLEQLTSSHSVGGAIKQPFMLRSFNWTSVVLFVLWGLSPLAGQAILRMSSTNQISDTRPYTVQYFQPQNLDPIYRALETGDQTALAEVNAMYTSLLVGNDAGQRASQDTWTNVKIPVYDDELSRFLADDGWWYPFDNATLGATRFSSLIGIPVWIPNTGYDDSNTTFSVETSYFVLNCPNVTPLNVSDSELASLNQTISPGGTLYLSAANTTEEVDGFGQGAGSFTAGFNGTIYFGSRGTSKINGHPFLGEYADLVQSSSCDYSIVNVLTDLQCNGYENDALCEVLRQKPLNTEGKRSQFLGNNFVRSMLTMAGPTTNDATTPTLSEKFIFNSGFATNSSGVVWQDEAGQDFPPAYDEFKGLANVTGAQLNDNFGRLVNTLWMAGSAHPAFHGGNISKLSLDGGTFNLTTAAGNTTGEPYLVYSVNWPWLAVLVACSAILLAAAVASAAWERRTIGPDFIGFANTALKRNVRLPRDMNALSARDRLLALQECEILLQDVRPDADVGKIALGVKEESSRRLVPGRQYR